MLARLGFSKRLLALIILVLFAAWALGTGTAYVWLKGSQKTARLPFPAQAAAIVRLVDEANVERRETVLQALGGENFLIAISANAPDEMGRVRMPVVEWYMAQYLEPQDKRSVVVTLERTPGSVSDAVDLSEYWTYSRTPLRIAVSLNSGGYVHFETRGDLLRSVFGFPAGFWLGVIGALIGAGAIVGLMREARPLRELAAVVADFNADSAPPPVKPRGAPEIRALMGAINDMQMRVAELIRARTILLGAISHDLKTILTRLRLRMEAIADSEKYVKAERDIDEMTRILDDAIAVAKGSSVAHRQELVDLAALVIEEAQERCGLATVKQLETARVYVKADPVALRRVVNNLLDNALRFGRNAEIGVTSDAGVVRLTVGDDGPGIPEADRQRVFEPFTRLDQSRNRSIGGSGLGLAIAKQIIEAHGGAITIGDSSFGGAHLQVDLPAARPDNANTLLGDEQWLK